MKKFLHEPSWYVFKKDVDAGVINRVKISGSRFIRGKMHLYVQVSERKSVPYPEDELIPEKDVGKIVELIRKNN